MTSKQLKVLDYLKAFIHDKRGVSPSFEEIKTACGFKSKSEVHRIIKALEEQGYIRRQINRARRIEVVDNPELPTGLSAFSTDDLAREAKRRGLVLGHLFARVIRDGNNGTVKRTFSQIKVD